MREISVCKEEILRRGKERIAARRRMRKRILAFSLPLCVIVTMWSVMILPSMMPAKSEDRFADASPEEDGLSAESTGLTDPVIRVEILMAGEESTLTSAEDITDVWTSVMEYFKEDQEVAGEAFGGVQDSGSGDQKYETYAAEVQIRFVDANGKARVFTLSESYLFDGSAMKEVLLSEEEKQTLIEDLSDVLKGE